MLTVKAKHATMLLTVNEVDGLSDGMDELSDEELPGAVATAAANKQLPAHPSVVMVSSKALFWTHVQSHRDTQHSCVCVCVSVSQSGTEEPPWVIREFLKGVEFISQ